MLKIFAALLYSKIEDGKWLKIKFLAGILYLKQNIADKKKLELRFLGIKILQIPPKSLALLVFDGLGDHVLRRNYIEYIKNSKKYQNYNIIIISNNNLYDLIKVYDNYADEVILLNKDNVDDTIKYLNKKNIIDFVDTHAYTWRPNEKTVLKIFKKVKAKNKIAFKFDCFEKISLKNMGYTKIIETPSEKIFEFERNRLFFSQLINQNIPKISHPKIIPQFSIPSDMICLTVSSAEIHSDYVKNWDIYNYSKLCNKILANFPEFKIMIIGTSVSKEKEEQLLYSIEYPERVINKIGKTSSSQLPAIIASSKYLISPESGLVHLAAAIENGPSVFCISNGSFYNRFIPHQIDRIKYIFPDKVDKILPSKNNKIDFYYDAIDISINDVNVEKIFEIIYKELHSNCKV